MEEILASIRRIISDEEGDAAPAAPAKAEAVPESADGEEAGLSQEELDKLFDEPAGSDDEDDADVLELTDEQRVDEEADIELTEAGDIGFSSEPETPVASSEPPPVYSSGPPDASHLLSSGPDATVTAAFQNLTNTVLSQNARTIEDLVKEMLRPMLRTWLDENLPPLVERLVRQEIERVARGS